MSGASDQVRKVGGRVRDSDRAVVVIFEFSVLEQASEEVRRDQQLEENRTNPVVSTSSLAPSSEVATMLFESGGRMRKDEGGGGDPERLVHLPCEGIDCASTTERRSG